MGTVVGFAPTTFRSVPDALLTELYRSDLYMWKLRCFDRYEFFAYLVITGPFATGGHDSTRHPSLFGISTDGSFLPWHRPVSKCLSPLGILGGFFIGYHSSLTFPAVSRPAVSAESTIRQGTLLWLWEWQDSNLQPTALVSRPLSD